MGHNGRLDEALARAPEPGLSVKRLPLLLAIAKAAPHWLPDGNGALAVAAATASRAALPTVVGDAGVSASAR